MYPAFVTPCRSTRSFFDINKKFGRIETLRPSHKNDKSSSASVTQQETKNILYPVTEPHTTSTLSVSSLHTLSYSIHGNSDGLPALALHGGPGAGSFPNHARFFDPARYKIVLFDQRGCGKSTPRGELRNNTFDALVDDCEALKKHLDVDAWNVVLGGSWGVALALGYAQRYPSSVGGLVLRGICCMRPREVDWLFGDEGGAREWDEHGWRTFQNVVVEEDSSLEKRTVLTKYRDIFLGEDYYAMGIAAMNWFGWERKIDSLFKNDESRKIKEVRKWTRLRDDANDPIKLSWDSCKWTMHYTSRGGNNTKYHELKEDVVQKNLRRFGIEPTRSNSSLTVDKNSTRKIQPSFVNSTRSLSNQTFIPAQSILTSHYSLNDGFIGNFTLLDCDRIDKIRHIPCEAIQGGLDMICPPDTMLDLHEVWPEMNVAVVLDCGHSMYEEGISKEIVRATDLFSRN